MRYMLLIYENEALNANATAEDWERAMQAHTAFGREAHERGMKPSGDALQPTATAKTVRFQNGAATVVVDGPFAETKEQLGGFYILDCESEADALAMARKLPLDVGSVEVRPVIEF